jgi:hypothetical protein
VALADPGRYGRCDWLRGDREQGRVARFFRRAATQFATVRAPVIDEFHVSPRVGNLAKGPWLMRAKALKVLAVVDDRTIRFVRGLVSWAGYRMARRENPPGRAPKGAVVIAFLLFKPRSLDKLRESDVD